MAVQAQEEVITIERDDQRIIERKVRAFGRPSEEPDYVKLYLRAWCAFKQVRGINSPLLYELLQYMTFADEGQEIILNATLKKRIADKLGWSQKTYLARFDAELSRFIKAGLLKRTGTGIFAVNPELIGKGSWKDVKKFRVVFNVMGEDEGSVEPYMFD